MPTLIFYTASYFAILLVGAFALVMLRRLLRREPLFTERDWLSLFGCPREEVFNLSIWCRFFAGVVIVSLLGFAESVFLLPLGNEVFLPVLVLTVGGIFLFAFRFFRLPDAHESTNWRQAD